jgi:hypothetical protein
MVTVEVRGKYVPYVHQQQQQQQHFFLMMVVFKILQVLPVVLRSARNTST